MASNKRRSTSTGRRIGGTAKLVINTGRPTAHVAREIGVGEHCWTTGSKAVNWAAAVVWSLRQTLNRTGAWRSG
jgi:hypothetical protein